MAEKKVKVTVPGLGVIEGYEVEVTETAERWSELTLSDGTVLRIKPVVLSVIRLENTFDNDGNPIYQVKTNQVMSTNVPENLKKDATGPSKKSH
ncbi:MAG: hypothetical protein A3J29_18810 [Acidobacteria bacterium RIFCSPLOWO2_12_FULL_67_14b]|nr:MAG: hypothetical protein A3J29_18810 [Acidobacteria bacterium RIFCSPLOWO2_12_FULL_67_14b]